MVSISGLTKIAGGFISKNAPIILTVGGCVGMVATVVSAVIETPKAYGVLYDAENNEIIDPAPKKEDPFMNKVYYIWDVTKIVFPVVWPTILLGCASIGCVISAHYISNKRFRVMAETAQISAGLVKHYQNQLISEVGKQGEEQFRKKVLNSVSGNKAKKEIVDKKENYTVNEKEFVNTGFGSDLFLDENTGQVLVSSMSHMQDVANYFYKRTDHGVNVDDIIYWNDILDEFGERSIKFGGEYIGIDVGRDVNIHIDKNRTAMVNGRPAYILTYDVDILTDSHGNYFSALE